MRRVLVLGSGGAGKSTLSRRLGELLGVEVVHLDTLYWRAGWVAAPKQAWDDALADVLRREAWVMDGNFAASLPARLAAADAVVFLDLPRRLCLWHIFRRWLRYRGRTRPDMAPGCVEGFDWEFLRWVWNFPARARPLVLRELRQHGAGKRVFVLRSPRHVSRFLREVVAESRGGPVAAV